jgi:HEPN domain-containing protein
MDQSTWEAILKNFMDLYITPEINKRMKTGELSSDFVLSAAQVIFNPEKDNAVVRLNHEMRVQAHLKTNSNIKDLKIINSVDVEAISNLSLLPSDGEDCGHFTMIKINNGWSAYFDFRYYKGTCRNYLEAARQFLKVADFSMRNSLWNAFYDNAFSAAELAAKSALLTTSGNKPESVKNHKAIKSKFNFAAKIGNVQRQQSKVLNKLSEKRKEARYIEKNENIKSDDSAEILESIKNMIEHAESGIKTFEINAKLKD